MLNNLRKLPDNVELVLRSLKKGTERFDRAKVRESLDRYGNPSAKRLLCEIYGDNLAPGAPQARLLY